MIDHEQRRTRIGGSEIACILDLDPYRDQYSLWGFKRKMFEREPMTLRMRFGQLFEPGILQAYAEQTGRELEPSGHMVHSLPYPFMVFSPDALVKGERRGVDAKFVSFDQLGHGRWSDSVDSIPAHIQLQALWYMAAMDYEYWDIAAATSNCDLLIYTIERDRDFEGWVLERAEHWWKRYLIGDEIPPIGTSAETARFIKQRFPRNREQLKRATAHQVALLESYGAVGQEWDAVNNRFIEIENQLKVEVGNAEGLEWPRGKFTWKATKDTEEIHWDGLAAKLLKGYSPDERTALIHEFTEPKPGSRRVYFRMKEATNAR
jgi:predicted phage-related endonuclease